MNVQTPPRYQNSLLTASHTVPGMKFRPKTCLRQGDKPTQARGTCDHVRAGYVTPGNTRLINGERIGSSIYLRQCVIFESRYKTTQSSSNIYSIHTYIYMYSFRQAAPRRGSINTQRLDPLESNFRDLAVRRYSRCIGNNTREALPLLGLQSGT